MSLRGGNSRCVVLTTERKNAKIVFLKTQMQELRPYFIIFFVRVLWSLLVASYIISGHFMDGKAPVRLACKSDDHHYAVNKVRWEFV